MIVLFIIWLILMSTFLGWRVICGNVQKRPSCSLAHGDTVLCQALI